MPTLADIYSAADSFKRRLSDAASNPSGALSQMLGYANDRARNFNELNRQAADEAIASRNPFANGPANQALDQAYMEAAQVPATTGQWKPSFHGTNRDFVDFNPRKSFGDLGVVWTTPEESFAQRYAGKEGKVMPLEVNEGKNFDFSNAEQLEKLKEKAKKVDIYDPLRGMTTLDTKVPSVEDQGSYKVAEHPQLFNLLKKMGYDSVSVYEDGVRNVGFFRPQKNIKLK